MFRSGSMGKAERDPLTLARAAVERGDEEVRVSAEDAVSASNVVRFLEGEGFRVQLQDDDGRLTLTGRRGTDLNSAAQPRPAPHAERRLVEAEAPMPTARPMPLCDASGEVAGTTLLIREKTLGRGNEELGEILIKSFLATLTRMDTASRGGGKGTVPQRPSPEAIVLMNEGVKLALFDTSTCDHLKDLEARGTRVLVSGACAGYFGVTENIGVGVIASMFDILDALQRAERVLTL